MKVSYKHIDISKIAEVTEGSPELLADMVKIFSQQIPEYTRNLEQLQSSTNALELGKLAHKIKGTVSLLGITELVFSMKEIERLADKNAAKEEFVPLIDQFKKLSNLALVELNHFLNRTKTSNHGKH